MELPIAVYDFIRSLQTLPCVPTAFENAGGELSSFLC